MSFGKRSGGGRRTAQREAAPAVAVFTTVTESHGAVMVDLSTTGARFRSPQHPELDEELIITVESVRAFGRVAWIDGNQFGVQVDDPIGPLDVMKIRGKLMKTAGLAPEMSAAMDDWQTGLAR